jgi:protein-tyrosine-phosphatase/DNA-binding transcriptional ArsR family regulator
MLTDYRRQTTIGMKATKVIPAAPSALEALKLLADDTRWQLIGELRNSDRQVGELVERLKVPQNLMSYHLGLLRQSGLVQVRRSDMDARVLYYGLDLAAIQAAYQQIGASLHIPDLVAPTTLPGTLVVFLCTENSARSQIAEGWLRQMSGGRVPVRSAGTEPRALHPLAVQVMAEVGVDIGYQQAKGLDAIRQDQPGVVVTVCDRAREACEPCLEAPIQFHWSIPDPVRTTKRESDHLAAFRAVRDELRTRVEGLLTTLPELMAEDRPRT